MTRITGERERESKGESELQKREGKQMRKEKERAKNAKKEQYGIVQNSIMQHDVVLYSTI